MQIVTQKQCFLFKGFDNVQFLRKIIFFYFYTNIHGLEYSEHDEKRFNVINEKHLTNDKKYIVSKGLPNIGT